MLRARLAPVLALALAGGCGEDPSFSVRWELHPYTDAEVTSKQAPTLVSVDQCTELGISRIRMTTRNDAGDIVDEREFPCFPGEFADARALAPGPEVGPGEYSVTLTAIGRRGIPFCDDDPDDGAGDVGSTGTTGTDAAPMFTCKEAGASDARAVVVREAGENRPVKDFVIVGVPQCRDGVDNDRDGSTDLADPSCRGDREGAEVGDLAAAQLIVRPQFMSGNPNAFCAGLGLRDIDVYIAGPSNIQRRFGCTASAQTITEDLEPGDYQLGVTGLGYDGSLRAVVALDPALASFTLAPAGFQTVDLPADFTIASFLAPIEARFAFSLEYFPEPDAPGVSSCTPVPGGLALESVRVSFLEDGQPAPEYLMPKETAGNRLPPPVPQLRVGEVTTLPCGEFLKTRPTNIVRWAEPSETPESYRALSVVVEAFPAGSDTPCYGTIEPALAAPNASFVIPMLRLSDQGACADSMP